MTHHHADTSRTATHCNGVVVGETLDDGSMASYDAEAMELRVQLTITAINRSFTSLQTTTNEEGEGA